MAVTLTPAQQDLLDKIASGQVLRRHLDYTAQAVVWTLAKDIYSPRKHRINRRTGEILRDHGLIASTAAEPRRMQLTDAGRRQVSEGVVIK